MPLPVEWLHALFDESPILVVSDSGVRNRVNSKQSALRVQATAAGKPAPIFKPLSLTPNLPQQLNVRPITLLHAIGRATTPPVANMSDISSTWAILRYVWALGPRSPSKSFQAFLKTLNPVLVGPLSPRYLALSNAAKSIDFHQKTLMSDEMGIGFAWIVMEHLFGVTDGIDFSRAIAAMNVNPNGRRTPDYVFRRSATQVFVVECKGSRTSLAETVDQLLSGSEQVASCRFPLGVVTNRIVCATRFCPEHIAVYIYDPDIPASVTPDKMELHWREQKKLRSVEFSAKEYYNIEARQSFAKTLTYCGLHEEARKVARFDAGSNITNISDPRLLTVDGRRYIGSYERLLSVDGESISVFKGLNIEEYQRKQRDLNVRLLAPRDLGRNLAPRGFSRALPVGEGAKRNVRAYQDNKAIEVQSFASDGTVVTITISRS